MGTLRVLMALLALVCTGHSTELIQPKFHEISSVFSRRSSSNSADGKTGNSGCSCDIVEIATTKDSVLRKHGELLGRYTRIENGLFNGRPSYQHFSAKFFLYYNSASQGFWAVGEELGSEVVRLENQGDRMCPYYLKSMWRYADGDLNALVYDVSLRAACMSDPCSVAHCGHQVILEKSPERSRV